LGSLVFLPRLGNQAAVPFPAADRLGRVKNGMVEVKKKPDVDSLTVDKLYEDAVVPWVHEVIGKNLYRINKRWVEIP
jgi:hypothetical protein